MEKRYYVVLYRQCLPGYGSPEASKWREVFRSRSERERDQFYLKELANCGGETWKVRRSMRA